MQDIQYATPMKWLFDTPGCRDPRVENHCSKAWKQNSCYPKVLTTGICGQKGKQKGNRQKDRKRRLLCSGTKCKCDS